MELIHPNIYIYIYRERERESEREINVTLSNTHMSNKVKTVV
jgi:hypothetical protein